MSLVYLASPYSHADPEVKRQRYEAACKAAGKLMASGVCVFSPIAHSHAIEQFFGKLEGHDFWLKQDFAVLRHCSELMVLRLDGWDRSFGVGEEIKLATQLHIPVLYVDP